jgi:hypothetical protein
LFLRVIDTTGTKIEVGSVDVSTDPNRIVVQNKWGESIGAILTNPAHRGKVFVKGLFMFMLPWGGEEARFGYDFDELKLDESRRMADPYNFRVKIGELHMLGASHPAVMTYLADRIVTGEEVGYISPYDTTPVLAKEVIDRLIKQTPGYTPETVIIPNSPEILESAKAVGLKTLTVSYGVWNVIRNHIADPAAEIESARYSYTWIESLLTMPESSRRHWLEYVSSAFANAWTEHSSVETDDNGFKHQMIPAVDVVRFNNDTRMRFVKTSTDKYPVVGMFLVDIRLFEESLPEFFQHLVECLQDPAVQEFKIPNLVGRMIALLV